jgi:hypothetical protein
VPEERVQGDRNDDDRLRRRHSQTSRYKSPRAILLADAMAPCGRERAGARRRAHGSHGKSWDDAAVHGRDAAAALEQTGAPQKRSLVRSGGHRPRPICTCMGTNVWHTRNKLTT